MPDLHQSQWSHQHFKTQDVQTKLNTTTIYLEKPLLNFHQYKKPETIKVIEIIDLKITLIRKEINFLLEIESVGSNLIDFNSDLPSSQHSRHPSQHFHQEPEYVNGDIPNPRKSSNRDPFDMSKTKINHNSLLIFKKNFLFFFRSICYESTHKYSRCYQSTTWTRGMVSRSSKSRSGWTTFTKCKFSISRKKMI